MGILGQVQPGLDLCQGIGEGALLDDRDGGQGGVAADRLRVPVDGVAQQLSHQVHCLDQRVQLAVKAAAVRNAQHAL